MTPKFSIILPVHNAEKHIHKALDSIAKQTFKNYEVLPICDSCTDNTSQVIYDYGFTPLFVEYGADGLTRNKGIELATGEFILFMDDDDWWLHEYVLEQLNERLKLLPTTDILCFSFIFKGVGYALPRGLKYQSDMSIRNDKKWHWIACWNKCWRRSAIGNSRFSGVKDGSADVQFHYLMMQKKLNVVDWDMPMYYYNYKREGSITERNEHKDSVSV